MDLRKCPRCKQLKKIEDFYKGKCSYCKQCDRVIQKARRGKIKDKGLCLRCQKNEAREGHVICEECKVKNKIEDSRRKKEVMNAYGGKCNCCGEDRLEFLCIDHINGDGRQHRERFKGRGCGQEIYRWLKKNDYPDSFQVLCFNCNHAQGLFNDCPHNKDFNYLKETQMASPIKLPRVCNECGLEKDISDFFYDKSEDKYYGHCKNCHNNRVRVSSRRLKLQCLEYYGGAVCQCCGETKIEFLTLDHIERNGQEHRKQLNKHGKGAHIYRWIKKNGFPEGFRVLCMSCNFVIGHFGYCPHQLEPN